MPFKPEQGTNITISGLLQAYLNLSKLITEFCVATVIFFVELAIKCTIITEVLRKPQLRRWPRLDEDDPFSTCWETQHQDNDHPCMVAFLISHTEKCWQEILACRNVKINIPSKELTNLLIFESLQTHVCRHYRGLYKNEPNRETTCGEFIVKGTNIQNIKNQLNKAFLAPHLNLIKYATFELSNKTLFTLWSIKWIRDLERSRYFLLQS